MRGTDCASVAPICVENHHAKHGNCSCFKILGCLEKSLVHMMHPNWSLKALLAPKMFFGGPHYTSLEIKFYIKVQT